jgi:hypothetical protein
MGPEEKKGKGFAESFAEAFEKAMEEEHKEYEAMPKKHEAGEGVMEVVEPGGEGHFELE